jgi:hypothetical protein
MRKTDDNVNNGDGLAKSLTLWLGHAAKAHHQVRHAANWTNKKGFHSRLSSPGGVRYVLRLKFANSAKSKAMYPM